MRFALAAILLLLACSTPDTTEPSVVTYSPAAGATNVARNASIRVLFSEAMDAVVTESSLSVVPAVTGAFTWPNDSTMIFTPSQPLDSLTMYTATVRTGAFDIAGNAIPAEVLWSFTTGTSVRSATLVMFGRSVLQGWFSHWGWDGDEATPVQRTRFELRHRYLSGPEDDGANTIADFREQVNALSSADSPVVFFKLCFVDFAGGDSATAADNLVRNKNLVAQLVASVRDSFGYRLVVGNALPVTRSEHDEWRYWNHVRYNVFLDSIAAASPGRVFVLDIYSTLTNPSGHYLITQYQTGPDDAHPNEAGYSVLDPALDELLEQHF